MFRADQYELLDFGQGRKLERFGALVVDRPAPAASNREVGDTALWTAVDAYQSNSRSRSGTIASVFAGPTEWHVSAL